MDKNLYKSIFKYIKSALFTALILFVAWFISTLLLPNTGVENNSALIFVLAVVIISMATDGYVFGIAASLISAVIINCFFMAPYGNFNLSLNGYPVAIISTVTVAIVICALTAKIKQHAKAAEERERRTKELYAKNSKLEKEKAAMEIDTAKAEIRSNILMSVSHDLRSPITAIQGAASVILEQDAPEYHDENVELVKDINDQAKWMSVMVENIISVAKLGSDIKGSLVLHPEVPDEIIESCVARSMRLFPNARIELHLSEEVVLVNAEPVLMSQVLQNLIQNALRHSGSEKPIEIETKIVPEGYEFIVRDHGMGLPEDIFTQINKGGTILMDHNMSGDRRSRGIGISACQSILKAHGSRLYASVPEGGGTELSFCLSTVDPETETEEGVINE